MSALMAASQTARAPSGATGPQTGTTPNTIPVPEYPVAGFNQYTNPNYYESQGGTNTARTPQKSQATPTTPQTKFSPQDTKRSSRTPATGAPINTPQGEMKPQSGTTRRSQTENINPSGPGIGNVPTAGNGAGRPGAQRGPDISTGSGRVPSPSDSRQPRPSESIKNPRLLTVVGHQPTALTAAATTSPFPHAFERWEMLSSQWEGLTRYWIRRLEQNQEEISRDPLGVQMSRNITDLSAAGANLFHAVVELQRLRASSERKFQRWFFETRADQERSREMTSELENTLRNERQKRADAMATIARLEKEKATADKLVEEVRRELQISREEARRAWEELGRREQEERERTNSLRGGHPTLVGGVQVLPMPMPGVPNRSGTTSTRPRTSTNTAQPQPPQQYAPPAPVAANVQPVSQPTGPMSDITHPMSPEYSMDALTENTDYHGQGPEGYHAPPLHHEPHLPQVPSPPGSNQGRQQVQTHPSISPYASEASQSIHGQQPPAQQYPSTSQKPQTVSTVPGVFYQQVQQPTVHPLPERTFSPGEESVVSQPGQRPSSQASVSISLPSDDGRDQEEWEQDIQAVGIPTGNQYSSQPPPQQYGQGGPYYDPRMQQQQQQYPQGLPQQQYQYAPGQGHPQQQQQQYPPQGQQQYSPQSQQQYSPQNQQQYPPQGYPPQGQQQQQHPQNPQQYQQQQQQRPQMGDNGSVAAGGWGQGWEALGSRYDHPTRLSEIMEVDETRTHTSVSAEDTRADRNLAERGYRR